MVKTNFQLVSNCNQCIAPFEYTLKKNSKQFPFFALLFLEAAKSPSKTVAHRIRTVLRRQNQQNAIFSNIIYKFVFLFLVFRISDCKPIPCLIVNYFAYLFLTISISLPVRFSFGKYLQQSNTQRDKKWFSFKWRNGSREIKCLQLFKIVEIQNTYYQFHGDIDQRNSMHVNFHKTKSKRSKNEISAND